MASLLLLAALPEEANAIFPHDLGVSDKHCGFARRRVAAHGHDITIVITGLGKVNAAVAAGLFGAEADYLLMVGTCGALSAAAGPYWIAEAVQHDYGAAEEGGFRRYRAGDWPMGAGRPLNFLSHGNALADLPHAHIASGDSFVADPIAAAEMAEALAVHLVDMEVAAVAQAATQMGKPWAAIKAVTDEANGDSGGDFHSNLLRAAGQAADAMEQWIAAIG